MSKVRKSDAKQNSLNVTDDETARDTACSVVFLIRATPGLFPALRKTLEHSTVSRSKFVLRAGNTSVLLKNSIEHAEPMFFALFFQTFQLLFRFLNSFNHLSDIF